MQGSDNTFYQCELCDCHNLWSEWELGVIGGSDSMSAECEREWQGATSNT